MKLLELGKSGNHYRVERYAVEPLPQNAVVENAITDVEQVGRAVDRVVKRSGTKSCNAAVAVSSSHVITKRILIPGGLREEELEQQIEMEADHYIPYPLDEVNLNFEVIGPSESNANEDEVLIAACRKEIVDDYVAVVEGPGLTPIVVDVDTFAIEAAYGLIMSQSAGTSLEQIVAVLDVGATTTHVNMMNNNRSVYTRDHALGGRQLTEEIQRRYGLSYEEAGMAKKLGGLPDNYQTDVLRPFMEAICQETLRALQFFYSSTPFNNVDQILLAGGCAKIPGIGEMIAERVNIPTIIASPFASMSLSNRVTSQQLNAESPALLVACGLALRSFD
ncbi:MAG: Cell division protein FtsA [Gammaproteobacteria bacterium]|nr:Cell division protein FtsA [Gammaproteobacteria bacterium]